MTAYSAAELASGQSIYRSAPQGPAVRQAIKPSRSLTTSASPATKQTAKPAPDKSKS